MSLAEVEAGEARNLNEQALRDLLRGIRDDALIPPVVVFRELGAATARLLDGMHRWRLSQALGYIAIPTIQRGREDAEIVNAEFCVVVRDLRELRDILDVVAHPINASTGAVSDVPFSTSLNRGFLRMEFLSHGVDKLPPAMYPTLSFGAVERLIPW
jgi:hypothetical protein